MIALRITNVGLNNYQLFQSNLLQWNLDTTKCQKTGKIRYRFRCIEVLFQIFILLLGATENRLLYRTHGNIAARQFEVPLYCIAGLH